MQSINLVWCYLLFIFLLYSPGVSCLKSSILYKFSVVDIALVHYRFILKTERDLTAKETITQYISQKKSKLN